MKKLIAVFFISFFIINTMASAADKAPLYDDFTPEKISSFICSLTEKGEYYRAYAELLRLNSFYPTFLEPSVYGITVNYLFYKGKRYNDLLVSKSLDNSDDLYIPFSLFRIDSLIKLDRDEDAYSELKSLYDRADSAAYSDYIKRRSVYLSIISNKYNHDAENNRFAGYEEIYSYSDAVYSRKKSPYLGALAGLIPGMGYVYSGEPGTGLVAMIVIGAGSAVTYASYNSGVDSLALISGIITFFFYSGSIAGGYMQTVKYNDRLMETLEMRLDRELMPERDLEEIYFKFGLNSNDCK